MPSGIYIGRQASAVDKEDRGAFPRAFPYRLNPVVVSRSSSLRRDAVDVCRFAHCSTQRESTSILLDVGDWMQHLPPHGRKSGREGRGLLSRPGLSDSALSYAHLARIVQCEEIPYWQLKRHWRDCQFVKSPILQTVQAW